MSWITHPFPEATVEDFCVLTECVQDRMLMSPDWPHPGFIDYKKEKLPHRVRCLVAVELAILTLDYYGVYVHANEVHDSAKLIHPHLVMHGGIRHAQVHVPEGHTSRVMRRELRERGLGGQNRALPFAHPQVRAIAGMVIEPFSRLPAAICVAPG